MSDTISGTSLIYGNNVNFTLDRYNKTKSAIQLNNGYMNVSSGVYFYGGDFTVTAWVRIKTHVNWARLIDFGNGEANDNVFVYLSYVDTDKPGFKVFQGNTSLDFGVDVASNISLILGKWQHLAITLSGTMGSIYIDGQLTRESYEGQFLRPNNVVRKINYLGKSNFKDLETNADFDSVRIYNRSLNENEIRTVMAISDSFEEKITTQSITTYQNSIVSNNL